MKKLYVALVLMLVLMGGILSLNILSYHQEIANLDSGDQFISGSALPWPSPLD